jgi:hypothetical protein
MMNRELFDDVPEIKIIENIVEMMFKIQIMHFLDFYFTPEKLLIVLVSVEVASSRNFCFKRLFGSSSFQSLHV